MKEREVCMHFLKTKWLETIIVISMVLCGSIYACYELKSVSGISNQMISYFNCKIEYITIEIFCLTLFSHLKIMGVIWLIGLFTYLKNVNIILIAGLVFAYSFTITTFAGCVGIRNNYLFWLSLMMQGILIVSYLVIFYGFTLEKEIKIKKYGVEILKGCLICLLITMLEMF